MAILKFNGLSAFQLQFSLKIIEVSAGRIDEAGSLEGLELVRVGPDRFGQRILLLQVVLAVERGGLHVAERIFL